MTIPTVEADANKKLSVMIYSLTHLRLKSQCRVHCPNINLAALFSSCSDSKLINSSRGFSSVTNNEKNTISLKKIQTETEHKKRVFWHAQEFFDMHSFCTKQCMPKSLLP